MIPYIPEEITVHLGAPDSYAQNVTVPFIDYVKNVASSEIYPTWQEEALRANITTIVTFALNKIYTEFYRSKGYNFDITSRTAFDQAYVQGRNIFTNVAYIVDELFNDYMRRYNTVEPLAAKFCNGTTVTCEGLSQWGTENLAKQGYSYIEILRNYYGNNIEIVYAAPIKGIVPSYPGSSLREGDISKDVATMQTALNRISQDYPSIPKIYPVNGIFNETTLTAVKKFQQIFSLTVDGIIGKQTWYEIIRVYVGVKKLTELNSEGQKYINVSWSYPDAIVEGNKGIKVRHLQYMLAVIAEFNPAIQPVKVTGNFDQTTKQAVIDFQRENQIKANGVVDASTWNVIYNAYAGICEAQLSRGEIFPFQENLPLNNQANPITCQQNSNNTDDKNNQNNTKSTNLKTTKLNTQISNIDKGYSTTTRMTQYPGYNLTTGMVD